jgi:hypothetical protein
LRNLKLNALKIGERLAELLAFLCVFRRELPGTACNSNHLSADADTAFIQSLNGDLVSLARFAQNIFFGNFAIFEDEFTSGGSADTEFVFFFSDGKSGEIFFY